MALEPTDRLAVNESSESRLFPAAILSSIGGRRDIIKRTSFAGTLDRLDDQNPSNLNNQVSDHQIIMSQNDNSLIVEKLYQAVNGGDEKLQCLEQKTADDHAQDSMDRSS